MQLLKQGIALEGQREQQALELEKLVQEAYEAGRKDATAEASALRASQDRAAHQEVLQLLSQAEDRSLDAARWHAELDEVIALVEELCEWALGRELQESGALLHQLTYLAAQLAPSEHLVVKGAPQHLEVLQGLVTQFPTHPGATLSFVADDTLAGIAIEGQGSGQVSPLAAIRRVCGELRAR